jgi:hypothetical protein
LSPLQFEEESATTAVFSLTAGRKQAKLARMGRNRQIDPALKAWLDNVIVPALVRQFLAEIRTVGDNERNRITSTVSGTSIPEQVQ